MKSYILKVVKTKSAWKIESTLSLANRAGAESEGKKWDTVNRANKLASNISKEEGVSVTVEVYSRSGVLQTRAEW